MGLAPHLPTAQCRGHCYLFGIKIWLYQDLSPSPGQPEQHQDLAQQDTPHRHAVLHPTPNLSLGCRLYSTAQLGLGWSSQQPKARGPGNSGPFVHCLTQSLEIPHQPQGSFPGGLQRGGLAPLTSHLSQSRLSICPPDPPASHRGPSRDLILASSHLHTGWGSGPRVSKAVLPAGPHSGSGSPKSSLLPPHAGVKSPLASPAVTEAWVRLPLDPAAPQRVELSCHLGWIMVSHHLINSCISKWGRVSPGWRHRLVGVPWQGLHSDLPCAPDST